MKRSTLITVATLALAFSTTSTATACWYTPWLDPLAWFGLYGCGGYGGGYGVGQGCCNYASYQQPMYQQPVYPAYSAPVMSYPTAPVVPAVPTASNCNCNGTFAAAPAPRMSAVQVPVTTYRAVTQYVPQTTYRTQYQYAAPQPSVAYSNPAYAANTFPAQTYSPPAYTAGTIPQSAYGQQIIPQQMYDGGMSSGETYYNSDPTAFGAPTMQSPNVATPIPYPAGDVYGDHEYPTQSARPPVMPSRAAVPSSAAGVSPIRRVSYGVTPRSARTYPSALR